jgi:PAS domain S-box-containing protein
MQTVGLIKAGRRRFIAIFAIAMGLLLATIAFAYYTGLSALQSNRQLAHELTVMQHLEEFLSALKDMETGQRGFALTGGEDYLEPYTKARGEMDQHAAVLRGLAAKGDLTTESVERILQLTRDKSAELERTIQLRKERGAAAALAEIEKGQGKRLMDSIRADMAQLENRESTKIQICLARAHAAATLRTRAFITATLLNLAFLAWAGRQILNAITKRDAAAQDALNQKALLSTTLTSIGDAVICTNTKGEVTFLNTEAERLTGWSVGEALAKNISEIFPITNELTGQTVESPVTKVMRVGKVVRLANHTVLATRDGRHVPIDDSAAPVREEGGTLHGVVMVFRDVTERRKAELAKERLAAIVESSDDAIIGKTLEGTITSWNIGAERHFGYRPEEIIGKRIFTLVPPELAEQEMSIMRRLNQGERVEHLETVRLRKDGARVDVSLSSSPLKNKAGEIVGASQTARDITERRRLHRTERELAEELASVTRLNQLAIRFVSDQTPKDVLEDMLDAAIALTHAAKGNLQLFDPSTGTLSIAVARGFSQDWLAFFQTVSGQAAVCAEAMRTKNRIIISDVRASPLFAGTPALDVQLKESVLAVQSTPLLNRSGELLGMISTHFNQVHSPQDRELHWLDLLCRQAADGLERTRAEASLRQSEERARQEFSQLEAIYQTAPLGLCVFDLELRYRRINERLAQINGIPREGHIGKRVHDIVPSLANQAEHVQQRVLDSGQPVRYEFRGETPAQPGIERVWDERWYPIRDAAGAINRIGVVAEEITERKQMETELQRARTELQSRATSLEQTVAERTADLRATIAELEAFSYSLSHDMRAPLRTIQSFSEMVLREAGEKLSPMEKDLLNKTITAASRLDRLIQDVLMYNGVVRTPVRLTPVDVEHLVRQITDERPEFQPPKADIQIEGPLHRVHGHEAYLTQCITNFLDNAVKFVPPGTHPRISLKDELIDGQVRLWFEDNGIGIPQEARRRVFGIFERIHPDTTYPGTGIGLAIVCKAAERMGGSVGVESEPGRGSRFWLQLQAAKNP